MYFNSSSIKVSQPPVQNNPMAWKVHSTSVTVIAYFWESHFMLAVNQGMTKTVLELQQERVSSTYQNIQTKHQYAKQTIDIDNSIQYEHTQQLWMML